MQTLGRIRPTVSIKCDDLNLGLKWLQRSDLTSSSPPFWGVSNNFLMDTSKNGGEICWKILIQDLLLAKIVIFQFWAQNGHPFRTTLQNLLPPYDRTPIEKEDPMQQLGTIDPTVWPCIPDTQTHTFNCSIYSYIKLFFCKTSSACPLHWALK